MSTVPLSNGWSFVAGRFPRILVKGLLPFLGLSLQIPPPPREPEPRICRSRMEASRKTLRAEPVSVADLLVHHLPLGGTMAVYERVQLSNMFAEIVIGPGGFTLVGVGGEVEDPGLVVPRQIDQLPLIDHKPTTAHETTATKKTAAARGCQIRDRENRGPKAGRATRVRLPSSSGRATWA